MTLFTPVFAPSYGAQATTEYRVITNDFGDGYAQTIRDGLNNKKEMWELSWDILSVAEANSIETQLNSFAGTTFEWLTPNGATKSFRCSKFTRNYVSFTSTKISASFEESFA